METTAISAELASTPAEGSAVAAGYLVCIEGERSWTVRLPEPGRSGAPLELSIGRDPGAAVVLGDPLVSRNHARLLLVPEGLLLVDLDSRHGTTLNGERLAGSRLLRSGDVIGAGDSVIVVRQPVRVAAGPSVVEAGALLGRLGEEADRAQRYQRELAVVVVRPVGQVEHVGQVVEAASLMARLAPQLRAIDRVAVLGDSVVVVMPELGGDEADAVLEALAGGDAALWRGLAVGIAAAPFDGIDGDTLLGGARGAAALAAGGQRRWAREAMTELEAGGHQIQIADPAMLRLYELARRLARSSLPVLVLGETGAGKELAAAVVHAGSPRAAGPFISVNCAAIPESLAESELFGHARGAFSGAVVAKVGKLEAAHGGTLFLDELGELPLSIQAKLLRALESGEICRVGEVAPRQVDLRLVAATHRDLEAEVEAGRFRRDLFFRLGAARLVLPPLRDRPRDVACLAARFLEEEGGARRLAWSVAAAQALFFHGWPGNVRELRHAVQYAVSSAPDDAVEIETWHLPPVIGRKGWVGSGVGGAAGSEVGGRGVGAAGEVSAAGEMAAGSSSALAPESPSAGAAWSVGEERAGGAGDEAGAAGAASAAFRPIADEVRALERLRMVEALRATGGVQNRAAELIEMPLRTFATKLKRYRIAASDWSG